MIFKITGHTIAQNEQGCEIMNGLSVGSQVIIYWDKNNQYDPEAIAIAFNKKKIGYIPKNEKDKQAMLSILKSSNNNAVFGYVEKALTVEKGGEYEIKARWVEPFTMQEGWVSELHILYQDGNGLKSFTEDVVISFDEKEHVYMYGGKKLIGGTTLKKKYIEEFDSNSASARCVGWGLSQSEIVNAWDLHGVAAREFGSGIHKALEYNDLYLSKGYKKKSGEDAFRIGHPLLEKIVKDFNSFYKKLKFKGEVVPECLVSIVSKGVCGLCDRVLIVDKEQKICRIQDYKVNHSANKKGEVRLKKGVADELGVDTTKLSEYALQLNFYRLMLEHGGWEVQGLDAFVYEDKWKYYELPILNVII